MNNFGLREMVLSAWPVLSILCGMSIWSITIIVDRCLAFRKTSINLDAFIENLLDVIRTQGPDKAIDFCRRPRKAAVAVAAAILNQNGNRDAKERACQHALQFQINQLGSYLPALGTIASTAPFVGLFGTTTGIIKAFQSISASASGGPEVVSGGIAEALITTAFGLFVAIPATMGYNYLVRRTQRMAQEIDLAMYNLIEELEAGKEEK